MHGYYNSSVRKKYISYDNFLGYNIYYARNIENFGSYVSVKYQLNSLTAQYFDECNPRFI